VTSEHIEEEKAHEGCEVKLAWRLLARSTLDA
jgi:hypothetical protein